MLNGERKTKYLGFRVGYEQYLLTISAAQKAGVSITDYILSLLLPAINSSESFSPANSNSINTDDITLSEVVSENSSNGLNLSEQFFNDSVERLNQYNLKYNSHGK